MRTVALRWAAVSLLGLFCAVVPATAVRAQAATYNRAEVRADKVFTNYAYAHEFGSGVYDFQGRTLQVYGVPLSWRAREATAERPGLRLRLPVTLGFVDFRAEDVIDTGLPDRVDSVSVVPGIEMAFIVNEAWRLLPYAQAGVSSASETDVDTTVYGAGITAERRFPARRFKGLYAGEVIYSALEYRGDLPDDDFVRLRNSLEFSRGTGRQLAHAEVEYGLFVVLDAYVDPPTGPTTRLDVPEVQLETGIVLGTQPGLRAWRVPLPRLGLSYRFAGDVSSWRFVIGAPF